MLDGIILGVHQQPEAFVAAMRKLRRAGHLSAYISLAVSHGTISISADGGRICRPLVVCHKGRPRLKDQHIAKVGPVSLPAGLLCSHWCPGLHCSHRCPGVCFNNVCQAVSALRSISGTAAGLLSFTSHMQCKACSRV